MRVSREERIEGTREEGRVVQEGWEGARYAQADMSSTCNGSAGEIARYGLQGLRGLADCLGCSLWQGMGHGR